VRHAPFPVFIPTPTFKPWNRVTGFFGGSALGAAAVRYGAALAARAGVPFSIHTQLVGVTREGCEEVLSEAGLMRSISDGQTDWHVYEDGSFVENLYHVPSDSLVVIGAAGQNLVRELMFGSKLEAVQSTLPNPLIVIGPNCHRPWESLAKE